MEKSIGTHLSTTITLDDYLSEISTHEDKNTQPKDIYFGSIEHSKQPVYVKIFKCNNNDNFTVGNLFLRYNDASLNNNKCEEYMEVSIAGKELNTFKTRSRQKKIQIITQLLLEMDDIHAQKIIHNDIKPSNIILLKQKHITPVDSKIALPKQDEASILYCKFIDFELAKEFKTENGDTCTNKHLEMLESTAGTSTYNAPEKLSETNNYIHPKTDIYSLGLIFIDLIVEGEVDKEHLAINENNIWKTIEIKCNQIHPMKGQKIYGMLQKMVQPERQQKITARECLQMPDITDQVDVQDHTSYFFPSSTSSFLNSKPKSRNDEKEKAETYSSESVSSQESPKQKTKSIRKSQKKCCRCKTGDCLNCICHTNDIQCTSCGSASCKNKPREEANKRKRPSDESKSKKIRK